MPLAIGLAAAGALGGALSNRAKTTTSTQNSSYNNTSTSTPQLSPEQNSIYSLLTQNVMKRLQGQTPLAGYESTGLQNINSTSDAIRRSIEGRLASRGMLNSPMGATALSNLDVSRGTEAAQFRNSLPLLQNSLDLQNVGAAGTVFGLRPFGSTTTSSGTGSGTNITNQPGNVAGGALGGLGSALGFLIGQGAFPGMGGSGGGVTGVPSTVPSSVPGGGGGMDIAALIRLLGGMNSGGRPS